LYERPALPPGWALISEIALRASAETWSSTTEITDAGGQIRGITNDATAGEASLSRIEKSLLTGMHLQHQVSEIRPATSLNQQCIELFRSATRGRNIEFPRAGVALGSAAKPLLDELIQIAVDCPTTGVAITGHTDSTGDESVNQALSESRARAVATYMMARGIASDRLTIEGAGSSRPLVTEESAQAFRKNRRIEIEMILPTN
jgi:OOP family OmpA-OmpF porin